MGGGLGFSETLCRSWENVQRSSRTAVFLGARAHVAVQAEGGQESPVCGHPKLADAPVVGAGDSPASCSPNSRQICCTHMGLLVGVL